MLKLPASGAQGKHALRLLAAGAGKAQSKPGSNNKRQGQIPVLPREGYDAGWRPIAPCVRACRCCRDGYRCSRGPSPGQCSDQLRTQPVSCGRELGETAGGTLRGVRPAAWISTPMAPVSGWRSGAARWLPPSLMKPGAPFACDGSNLPPILNSNSSGKLLKAFGAGLLLFPPWHARGQRRQCLGHRRAWQGRKGPPGLQVQSGRPGADDARQGGCRGQRSG